MKHLLPILTSFVFITGSLGAVDTFGAADGVSLLKNRVASIFVSETFLNEQLALHSAKSEMFTDLKIDFDAEKDWMYLSGTFQLPLDDLRADLEKILGRFKFRITIKPRVSKRGYLVLEFPLSETYFYPANSKHLERDRVVIPVQLLSLALASMRGYLATLSGDFSGFDRKTAKLQALLGAMKHSIAKEKNPDALEALKAEKRSLEYQLAGIPIERDRLERSSKTLTNILGFSGEKDLNLNNEIQARANALILRLKFSKIIPYLKDIELGGVRINHNKQAGKGEDYFIVDVNSNVDQVSPPVEKKPRVPRASTAIAPSLQIRLNQDIFNSKIVLEAEKEQMGTNIRDFEVVFKDDGIHIKGKWHKYFFSIPFDSAVDFVTTAPDTFEVRLSELNVYGIDLKFLTSYALGAVKDRLDKALHGICTFEYLGDKNDSKTLQVKIEPKNLVPAFPDLHLVDVDVRDRAFMLRIGHTDQKGISP